MAGLPNMSDVLTEWLIPIIIQKAIETTVNYETIITYQVLKFNGVVQQTNPTKMDLSAQGQWNWQYLTIHTPTNLFLENGDTIIYNTQQFKVMESSNYSIYGFYSYNIVKDFGQQFNNA